MKGNEQGERKKLSFSSPTIINVDCINFENTIKEKMPRTIKGDDFIQVIKIGKMFMNEEHLNEERKLRFYRGKQTG